MIKLGEYGLLSSYVFSLGVRMVRYWWNSPYDSDKVVYNNIFTYLRCDHGAANLAKLPVVTGDDGGTVHRELIHALTPSLSETFDMIVIPEGDEDTLRNLMGFMYSGR